VKQAPANAGAHDRFRRSPVAELTIGLATIRRYDVVGPDD